MTVFKWSKTAASNATIDDTINARENQAPSTVNDAMRGIMAATAKWRDDLSGNLVTGGTSTAYTLTTNQVFTSLTDGIYVRCRMSATNGATPTLNVDGLGAKSIASIYGTAVPTGALLSGGVYDFVYDSTDDKWIVTGIVSLAGATGTLPIANGGTGATTAAAAATALGLGTGDSPQFTAVNIGNASDTTLARASAGNLSVEGNVIYRAGGTDVPVTDGGTGASTAADARTNLGLGSIATQAANNVAITGGTISGISTAASGTVATTTGGTDVEQTGIPSWVNVIHVSFVAVSSSGSGAITVQLGTASAYATSGYLAATQIGASTAASTSGFSLINTGASDSFHGVFTLVKHTGNTWTCSGNSARGTSGVGVVAGSIALADTLTRVRLNLAAGTFDAMSFNVTYL